MRRATRRPVLAIGGGLAVIALAALGVTPAAASDPVSSPTAAADETVVTLTDHVIAAAGKGVSLAALPEVLGLPESGAGSLSIDDEGRLSASVRYAEAPDATDLAQLAEVAEIARTFSFTPEVAVFVPLDALAQVAELPGVVSVTVNTAPLVGAASGWAASAVSETDCRDLPAQAREPLNSEVAIERFGVNGSGVTVGVISDSFGTLTSPTSWQDDVAAGLLPGPGNPCGWETPVEVIRESAVTTTDEGRGMAQLVHSIAPGARILFSTSGESQTEMADAILALEAAGADIIVDDIIFLDEVYYQADVISWAIQTVEERGVLYLTEVSNMSIVGAEGEPSAGRPIAGWRTEAYRPMACPEWVELAEGTGEIVDCLDFDAGPGEDATDRFLLGEGAYSSMVMSWGEPVHGVESNFALQLYEYVDDEYVLEAQSVRTDAARANALMHMNVTLEEAVTVEAVIVRTAESAETPTPALWFGWALNGAGQVAAREWDASGDGDVVGPSAWGHDAAGYGETVAAVPWNDADEIQTFSSLGPGVRLFEMALPSDTTPAAALPAPVTVGIPTIAGVDGMVTSVILGPETEVDGVTGYEFYGTSAATPSAGAVFALARQYAPEAAWADIRAAAHETTNAVINPFSAFGVADANVFGSGLIDAGRLLGALPVAAVSDLSADTVTDTEIAVSWHDLPPAAEFELEIRDVTGFELRSADAGSTGYRFTGLEAATDYTITVWGLNDTGERGAASTVDVTTSAPPAPTTPPAEPDADELTDAARGGLTGSPTTAAAGQTVTVDGLPPYSWVYGWFFSTPTATQWVWTGSSGSAGFAVPSSLAAGSHQLAVSSASGALLGWVPVTVTSSGGSPASLPIVGATVPVSLIAGASSIVIAGAGIVMWSMRRRAHS